jgi:hypothetical protein
MRSMVEGRLPGPKNPSTELRALPLPEKSWGGFRAACPPPPGPLTEAQEIKGG